MTTRPGVMYSVIILGLSGAAPILATAADADEPSPLTEIIVTAQKREQSVQDVPLSVSAVGAEQLADQGVFDLSRLDALVPGMKFGQSGDDARPAIRGTRTQQVIGNADPVVAYYVDGIYRSRPGQALSTFVDVERIEVLRGPQGTLFGRNSFGGAVNVISNSPDPSGLHAGAQLTAMNYQGLRAEGFVNLPLNDSSAIRIAGYSAKQNGWVENTANPQNSLHDLDDQFIRAQFLFKPTDDMSFKLRGEFWHGGGNGPGDFGYYVPGVPVDPGTGKTNGVSGVVRPYLSADPSGFFQGGIAGLYQPTPADQDARHIALNFPSERRVNQSTVSGEFAVGLGFADLKAIVSGTHYQEYRQDDGDFSAQPLWYNFNRVTAKTYTEELQLISKPGPLTWVVGAYLLQDKPTDYYVFGTDGTAPPQGSVSYAPQLFAPAFGVANPYAVDPNLYIQGPYRLDTKATAGYADLTWSLLDSLRLIGGARYTHDSKTADYDNPDYVIDDTPPTHAAKTFSKTTWRGGLQYDLAPKSMLYAMASTGFQSGGFNGNPSLTPFDQTTVKAYEIGSKNVLLENRLRANLALYWNDYTNLLSQQLITVGNAIQSLARNAGQVKARGAELELDWYPLDGTYLGLRSSFNHSRFGNFVANNSFTEGGTALGGGASVFQLNGYQVPLNPNETVTLIGSQDVVMGTAGILTPALTIFQSSSYRTTDQPYFFANQGAYATLDLSLRWRPEADSHLSAELFCENCTDKLILLRSTPNSGSVIYQDFAAPRMFGGRISYRF